jgi:hypothetical protein
MIEVLYGKDYCEYLLGAIKFEATNQDFINPTVYIKNELNFEYEFCRLNYQMSDKQKEFQAIITYSDVSKRLTQLDSLRFKEYIKAKREQRNRPLPE